MTVEQQKKDLKHNVLANIGDGAFFGFGVGFASFTTVIPLFISTLTSSATLIGLIPAIHNMGWQLPQLLLAKPIARMEKLKPFVLFMTINERLPILGLAVVGFLLPRISVQVALMLSFLLLIWQGLGAGFTANAWQIMISKVIPPDFRATFFGMQSAAANLLASLGAFLAGLILSAVKPPHSYSIVFIIASGLYVISWFSLRATREQPSIIVKDEASEITLWKNILTIFRTDTTFRSFLISRFVSQFGMMAFAFFTVYAVKKLGMNNLSVGVITSILMITQVVANPLLGKLADAWSRKRVLVLGSVVAAASSLLAILIKDPAWFVLVFICSGIAGTAYWTIGLTLSLEFGEESQRSTYVGMANTLIAPATIFAPLLGGLLVDSLGYPVMFITSAVFALGATVVLLCLVRDPQVSQ